MHCCKYSTAWISIDCNEVPVNHVQNEGSEDCGTNEKPHLHTAQSKPNSKTKREMEKSETQPI